MPPLHPHPALILPCPAPALLCSAPSAPHTHTQVEVKPGWKAGTRITFPGKGDERPGRPADDVVFVLKEAPHPRFTRSGNDLHTTVKVPLVTALTGGSVQVGHGEGGGSGREVEGNGGNGSTGGGRRIEFGSTATCGIYIHACVHGHGELDRRTYDAQ